jgi:hypothetical protein
VTGAAPACIGEPVSWLRLEQLALGELPPAVATVVTAHVDGCAACAACLAQIQGDAIELPALPAPRAAVKVPWWRRRWALGAGVAVATAAAILLVIALRPPPREPEQAALLTPRIRIKGAGEVVVDLVRERAGDTVLAPATYRAGDRFKVIVTCDEATEVWADVVVFQPDAAGRTGRPDRMVPSYPAAPLRLVCGNRVAVPGAFTITGTGPAAVCLALDVEHAPTREPLGRRKGIACYQLVSE